MRLGVSGKVFLAYAALLTVFAGDASFTLYTVHKARQGVVANQAYLDLQGATDTAWKALNNFAGLLGKDLKKDPRLALAFQAAQKGLDDAVAVIDRFLAEEPSTPRRFDFERTRRTIALLRAETERLAGQLGSTNATDFESRFAALTHNLSRLRAPLRGESNAIAQSLRDDGDTALQMALFLGLAGVVAALGATAFMVRTLRPLRILGGRARAVAAGDYTKRTGVSSRDEIGDLAREFDAMAAALEERESRLIQSERLATVGRMAAQITHEVRNPLASIGLHAELLADETADRPEGQRLVQAIINEVDRLTGITETYLRFARLPKPALAAEDLGALVRGAFEFARHELAAVGISLSVAVAPGLPEVWADENQIRQALLNLARNAREAMPRGGALLVEVTACEEGARVSLTDSGEGIPAENLPKIFDPFFSTKAKGTGLGLALVQQILVEHGGRVEVRSRPGEGTTVSLVLRGVDSRSASGEAPDSAANAQGASSATANRVDGSAAAPDGGEGRKPESERAVAESHSLLLAPRSEGSS